MELGLSILGAILVFMLGYIIGTSVTLNQWDSIIATYRQIALEYSKMYKDATEEYINEVKAHGKTINEFTEEKIKWTGKI